MQQLLHPRLLAMQGQVCRAKKNLKFANKADASSFNGVFTMI